MVAKTLRHPQLWSLTLHKNAIRFFPISISRETKAGDTVCMHALFFKDTSGVRVPIKGIGFWAGRIGGGHDRWKDLCFVGGQQGPAVAIGLLKIHSSWIPHKMCGFIV